MNNSELLKEWEEKFGELYPLDGENLYTCIDFIADLLTAAREEERLKAAEIVESIRTHWEKYGYPVQKDKELYSDIVDALKARILNNPKE